MLPLNKTQKIHSGNTASDFLFGKIKVCFENQKNICASINQELCELYQATLPTQTKTRSKNKKKVNKKDKQISPLKLSLTQQTKNQLLQDDCH